MNENSFSFGVEPDRIDRLLSLGMEASEADEAIDQTNPSDSLTEGPGQWIGRYKLLSVLGEGGMGTVYLAEQRQPIRRRVALKIIKIGMDTKQVIGRFEAERQALALMDHPHIAGVLDAGTTESGRPYFVMEMVKGIPITTYCDKELLDTNARLELFVRVCHAIQHAHQKEIIHRDIKPSNILVMPQDGIPVPKVIDFGIAKATQQELTEKTIYTLVSQFIGTPAYMSPEQTEMRRLDIDTRSDIYGLGVLLYELLTGTTPFDPEELLGAGFDEMRKIIQHQEPVKPSTRLRQTSVSSSSSKFPRATLHSPLATDLDWIVMKCLEKDRTRRYETAHGLAMDLRRHLSDETIIARPPSVTYKLRKAFRRNRALCTAAMMVVAALLVGIAVSAWQATRAREAEREQSRLKEEAQDLQQSETALRIVAEATSTRLREHLYVSEMYAAYEAFRAGSIQRTRELLDRQTEDATEGLRGFEWRWLWAQTRATEKFVIPLGEFRFVTAVDFSADGSRFLTLDDGRLQIWDTVTHELVSSHSHPFGYRAEYSRDGKLIISTETYARAVRLSDAGTGLDGFVCSVIHNRSWPPPSVRMAPCWHRQDPVPTVGWTVKSFFGMLHLKSNLPFCHPQDPNSSPTWHFPLMVAHWRLLAGVATSCSGT